MALAKDFTKIPGGPYSKLRLDFWLLDLNHEAHKGSSAIWLWGVTHDNKRVLVIDANFQAYFYLLPKKDQDIDQLREKMESEPHPSVNRVLLETRTLIVDR